MKKDDLLRMYSLMLKIRRVEERLMEIFAQGKIPGFIHVSIGQEAVPVGVCSVLRQDDYISNTHRGHGQALAKGADLKKFMAELFGRRDGYCKGKAGSMHVACKELGIIGSNGVVGGGIPISLGTAFASQYLASDRVTVCFFGDGATNEGTFHESLNLAAVWNLPMVFCCENNRWAEFTPQKIHTKLEDLSRRAEAYGFPGVTVDGDEVLKVREAAEKAVGRARKGEGPTLLECKTHRWFGHFAGDSQKYRDPKEIEEVRKFDPILRFQNLLLEMKHLTPELVKKMEDQLRAEIDEAVAFAESSPVPGKEDLLQDVYV
ncbi:MAG: pyruvate dehydrogenase component, alpha subunit [Deltaproteobacteria bacterium]|jgi:pyruvate dehydrogenase E1 component alpha subunit|nr:pyruvate dehydrogenase component, alpha subunit [Deltaproteobacteria bacterium]